MIRPPYARTALIASVAGCLALTGAALAQTQPAAPAQAQTPAPAQPQTAAPAQPQSAPGYSGSATQMPSVIPNKSETASSAFEKLDASHTGYLTKEQVAKLDGFDSAFTQADKDKDGKLNRNEFQAAWTIYTRG